jgi:hypothetical protein
MHGHFSRNLGEKRLCKEQLYQWIIFGDVKGKTESTIVAARDQATSANYIKTKTERKELT